MVEVLRRKYNGEEYVFYKNSIIRERNGEEEAYFTCFTPENALGYPDIVLVDHNAWTLDEKGYRIYKPRAYTLYRYLQPWILKRICKTIMELEEEKNV